MDEPKTAKEIVAKLVADMIRPKTFDEHMAELDRAELED